jgi:hypothetical protein
MSSMSPDSSNQIPPKLGHKWPNSGKNGWILAIAARFMSNWPESIKNNFIKNILQRKTFYIEINKALRKHYHLIHLKPDYLMKKKKKKKKKSKAYFVFFYVSF